VHKRVWNFNMWSKCCWSEERHKYYDGKKRAYATDFHVTAAAREQILGKLMGDAQFMDVNGCARA
jgi:hypothetical protein